MTMRRNANLIVSFPLLRALTVNALAAVLGVMLDAYHRRTFLRTGGTRSTRGAPVHVLPAMLISPWTAMWTLPQRQSRSESSMASHSTTASSQLGPQTSGATAFAGDTSSPCSSDSNAVSKGAASIPTATGASAAPPPVRPSQDGGVFEGLDSLMAPEPEPGRRSTEQSLSTGQDSTVEGPP
eukprot:CAMPEP_0202924252 /NCGR_PEP_ID=MMETSP1392-20130828/78876_1 /ASSEMBLY_ACC=CAM_ASM_000868 /TAXON_ID=225041 /ORGANISM="Chlamydomonas chlamydogama, Strain SAG 11-48b" /LENGTH=181 /DNA_ID=CAMNT_0049617971 /DNA_START=696 /DNA_END=1237 /DNA_ORIENTATION=+